MRGQKLLFALALAALAILSSAPAWAQDADQDGDAMGLGIGAQAFLTQTTVPAGASITYDAGVFHVDGILGFSSVGNNTLLGGGRFYYAIHRKASSDLSIGGGVGIEYQDLDETQGQENLLIYHIEAGAKIRAFLVPNVALGAGVGLGLLAGDGDGYFLTGQFIGTFGITYFLD